MHALRLPFVIRHSFCHSSFVILLLLLGSAEARGAEPDLSLSAVEGWSGVFGGAPCEFHFGVTGRKAFRGLAGSALTVDGCTIARHEEPIAVEPDKEGRITVRFDIPPVKEGVVVQALLSVSLYVQNAGKPEASLRKTLWVFPRTPFADRAEWLKQLKIHLFDPAGKTREILEKAGVPFAEAGNAASLAELREGMVIIGEGTSFEDHRGLPEIMVRAAAKGVPVLCLAPSEGRLVLPGTEEAELPKPTALALRGNDVITELDKRLDALAWPPDGKVATRTMTVKADRGRVVAEMAEGGAAWPWVEARFAERRGRLIVCGFGIIRAWEAGPSPRFLFARLLERLDARE